MIELTSGSTRIGSRVLRPSDGPFSADPDAEKRLVSAGVARYVYPANEWTARAIREAETGQSRTGMDAPPAVEGTAAPAPLEEETGVDGTESVEGADIGQPKETSADDDLYDADYLNSQTNARLKEIADDMGLNTSAMRKKADYVEAILAAQNEARDAEQDSGDGEEDGDAPPDLGAEDPVE